MKPFRAVAAVVVILASAVLWDGSAGAASKRFDHYSGPVVLGQNQQILVAAHNATGKEREVVLTVRRENGSQVAPYTGSNTLTVQSGRIGSTAYRCTILACGFSVHARTKVSGVHLTVTLWDGADAYHQVTGPGDWRIFKRS